MPSVIKMFAEKNPTWRQAFETLLQERKTSHMLGLAVGVFFLGCACFTGASYIYQIYLHPLAGYPGEKAAAVSQKWLLAQSKTGRAEQIFAELHKKHKSSAIRIGPNELHLDDVSLYKTIYSQTAPFLKHKGFYDAFNTPHTVFIETDPALHKKRRKLLNPFFSRAAILNTESLMVEKLKKVIARLDELGLNEVCNMYNMFRCVTVDIISQYAFGTSLDLTTTSDSDFQNSFIVAFDTMAEGIWDFAYSPALRTISHLTPRWFAEKASKKLGAIFGFLDFAERSVKQARASEKSDQKAIFNALDSLDDASAIAEAVDIFAAGSDTTAFTLSSAVWHIVKNADIEKRLVEELKSNIPVQENMLSIPKLEGLPFLTACVKESIRIAQAVPGRLPRLVPAAGDPFIVGNKVIPPGTIVGMSAYTMHSSTELWGADASSFNPLRWLESKTLDQNMVSFSKGLRSCIGQNLANAEITLGLAFLFRRYEMKIAPGSATAKGNDQFTSGIAAPGMLVTLRRRAE